jgi:hypothetical protein
MQPGELDNDLLPLLLEVCEDYLLTLVRSVTAKSTPSFALGI